MVNEIGVCALYLNSHFSFPSKNRSYPLPLLFCWAVVFFVDFFVKALHILRKLSHPKFEFKFYSS